MNVVERRGSLALDIGGTLAKALFVDSSPSQGALDAAARLTMSLGDRLGMRSAGDREGRRHIALSLKVPALNATLHFFSFETRYIEDCLDFVRNYAEAGTAGHRMRQKLLVRATGGGAYKYASQFRDVGVLLDRRDEMACLVNGISFLMKNVEQEVFSVASRLRSPIASPGVGFGYTTHYKPPTRNPYPYLLVNIGSGVSVLEVFAPGKTGFRRISGSSLGGSTFLGLACLLTGCRTFDEALELTRKGDVCKVDMLVGDLYSGDYTNMGLDAEVIAASFGKVVMRRSQKDAAEAATAALQPADGGSAPKSPNPSPSNGSEAKAVADAPPTRGGARGIGGPASQLRKTLTAALVGSIVLWLQVLKALWLLTLAALRGAGIPVATLQRAEVVARVLRGAFLRSAMGRWTAALLSSAAGEMAIEDERQVSELDGDGAPQDAVPFRREDVALSLLRMISNNIGQIAYLNARNAGVKTVVFSGSFLRGNKYCMAALSSALSYWSGGEMEARYLVHEGFAGALGAHLCGVDRLKLGLGGSIVSED